MPKYSAYGKKPTVFAVHKDETADGRYHEVSWAMDGNLNAAHKRGNVRQFRLWISAKKFANRKAKVLKTKAIFS